MKAFGPLFQGATRSLPARTRSLRLDRALLPPPCGRSGRSALMYLHMPRGTVAVGPQLSLGRGSALLTEDVKLSRQHALFSHASGRASVLWMARRPGRLATAGGAIREVRRLRSHDLWLTVQPSPQRLCSRYTIIAYNSHDQDTRSQLTRGTQHELQHADRLALLAETGRHVAVVHLDPLGEAPVHPSAAEWKQFEAAAKIEAMDAAQAEMIEQRQIVQALRSRHLPAEDGWARSELASLDDRVAAADSSDPSGSEEMGAAPRPSVLAWVVSASAASTSGAMSSLLQGETSGAAPPNRPAAALAPTPPLGRSTVAAGRGGGATSALRAAGGAAASRSGAGEAAAAIRAAGGAAIARLPARLGGGRPTEEVRLPVILHAVADAALPLELDETNRVQLLEPYSEAALSGVRDGDQLVSFNGIALTTHGPRLEDLLRRQFMLPGDAANLVFRRALSEHIDEAMRGPREVAETPDAPRHFRLPGERSALDQAKARAAYRKHYRRPARDPHTNQLLGNDFSGYLRDSGEPLHQ